MRPAPRKKTGECCRVRAHMPTHGGAPLNRRVACAHHAADRSPVTLRQGSAAVGMCAQSHRARTSPKHASASSSRRCTQASPPSQPRSARSQKSGRPVVTAAAGPRAAAGSRRSGPADLRCSATQISCTVGVVRRSQEGRDACLAALELPTTPGTPKSVCAARNASLLSPAPPTSPKLCAPAQQRRAPVQQRLLLLVRLLRRRPLGLFELEGQPVQLSLVVRRQRVLRLLHGGRRRLAGVGGGRRGGRRRRRAHHGEPGVVLVVQRRGARLRFRWGLR